MTNSQSVRTASQWAAITCRDPVFHQYIIDRARWRGINPPQPMDDEVAAQWVRLCCRVESRRELDTNAEARRMWHRIWEDWKRYKWQRGAQCA